MVKCGFLAAAATVCLAGNCCAGIHLDAGPGMLVVNPVNMRYTPDAYDIDRVFFWTERTSHTLAADLVVSILPPASFPTDSTSQANDNSLLIPSGTTVDSYLLNYDPQSGSTIAVFSFDDPIVGLIANARDSDPNDHLFLSDFLANPLVPGANLPGGHVDMRGIETAAADFVRWLSPWQIEVHLGASTPGDQIRIITSPVPEPGLTLLSATLLTAWFGSRPIRKPKAPRNAAVAGDSSVD